MASQLLGIKTRFTDDLGSPLVGGQVYTYFAGTSTNQDSYSDAALTVPNTNPVILDDTGSADIFLKGSYRIRVFDKSGRFIEEQDNVTQAASQGDATELSNKVNEVVDIIDGLPPFEGGVLADTFVVVDGSLSQRTINKGLASVADMLSINNPKTGLKVYVNSYFSTGERKGGGYFTYDSNKASINNQGTIIDGWVREPQSYIDMYAFGGDSYEGDPFAAAQAAIDYMVDGGTVSLDGFSGEKEFDGKLAISRPVIFVGNKSKLKLRLKDNADIFNNTGGDGTNSGSRSELVKITSSHVDFSNTHIDSNHINNFVMLDSKKYYFSENPEIHSPDYASKQGTPEYNTWVKLERMKFRYLATIVVEGNLQSVSVHHNVLLNNSVHAIGVSGTTTMLPDSTAPVPDLLKPLDYANDIKVYNNTISGGCRSGIYFIGGVINSEMYNNLAINWGWAAFRFYYSTNNCKMYNNYTVLDTDVSLANYENDDATYAPTYFGIGYRVGHRTRGAGSCQKSYIENNYYEVKGSHPQYDINEYGYKALKVEILSKDLIIENNTFRDHTTRSYAFNGFYDESGFCVIKSTDDIRFKGNKVYCGMPLSLHIQSSGNLNNNSKVVIDDSNEFTTKLNSKTVHIYGSSHATYTVGVNSADFHINNNIFEGVKGAAILNLSSTKDLYVKNNTFKGYDTNDTLSTIEQAVIQSQNNTGINIINTNNFEFKKGHGVNILAVKLTSISKGSVNNNTLIVDKTASTFRLIRTGMRSDATGDVTSQNNTYVKLNR